MAKTFTLQTTSYDGRYLKLTCSQTQNIANNTSTISWTLESIGGSVNYYSTGPTTLTINGEQVYYKERIGKDGFPGIKGSTSGTITVSHNTDGKKTIPVVLSTAIYYKTVSSVNNNWILDDIPRKATITAAPNFNDEENPTITYSNLAGNSVTKIEAGMSFVDEYLAVPYREISKTGTTYTFNLTDAERKALRQGVVSGSSRTIRFHIRTTIGSYTGWHTVEKTFSLVNYKPTISVVLRDNNPDTVALTGNSDRYIKGHSTASYTITASGHKEATIKEYYCNGVKTNASDAILNVSTDTLTFQAKDSRGNTGLYISALPMVNYVDVSCVQKVKIELDGETQAKITMTVEGTYFNGSFGNVSNELFVRVYYREVGEDGGGSVVLTEAYTPTYSGNSFTLTAPLPVSFDYSKAYVIETVVKDKLTTASSGEYTARLIPVFDWSDSDFNFNVPIKIKSQEMKDFVVDEGTVNSWGYRLWDSGKAECWRRLQITTAVSSAWGGLYTSGSLSSTNLSYPFTFAETPILNVSLMPFGSGGLVMATGNGYGSATQTGPFEIARGTSLSSGQFLLSYYAFGKWK